MPRTSVLLLAVIAVVFTTIPADAAPPEGRLAGKGRDGAGKDLLIKRFDKDGDRKLSDQEKEAAKEALKNRAGEKGAGPGREALRKRFDKNGDGQLNDDEKAAAKAEFGKRREARK